MWQPASRGRDRGRAASVTFAQSEPRAPASRRFCRSPIKYAMRGYIMQPREASRDSFKPTDTPVSRQNPMSSYA